LKKFLKKLVTDERGDALQAVVIAVVGIAIIWIIWSLVQAPVGKFFGNVAAWLNGTSSSPT
jgi:Flp pilus assembly pilin Flp